MSIQQHDEFFLNGVRYYTQEQLDAAVRQAEQRIDAGWRKYIEDNGGTGIEQFDLGYAAGVTAARDAVADFARPDNSPTYHQGLLDAVAAIDALPAQQNQNQNHDQQDRVNHQQQRVIHDPESQVTGERTTDATR